MTKVNWNEFRSHHKGLDADEISKLWKDYKDGEYILETQVVTTEATETTEEVIEETAVEEKTDHRKEFLSLFNQLYVVDGGKKNEVLHEQLLVHAKATRPDTYACGNGDGWTLYLGPTQSAVLVNETRHVAFSVTRAYWYKFYQGASLIDEQIFEDASGIKRLKTQFSRMNALVKRYPIPNIEIKAPSSNKDIPLPSGVN